MPATLIHLGIHERNICVSKRKEEGSVKVKASGIDISISSEIQLQYLYPRRDKWKIQVYVSLISNEQKKF
jgi:hypothetical protein